jgi:hypothetical protein
MLTHSQIFSVQYFDILAKLFENFGQNKIYLVKKANKKRICDINGILLSPIKLFLTIIYICKN